MVLCLVICFYMLVVWFYNAFHLFFVPFALALICFSYVFHMFFMCFDIVITGFFLMCFVCVSYEAESKTRAAGSPSRGVRPRCVPIFVGNKNI